MNGQALRIFSLDLREQVKGVWDENVPIVRHAVIECVGVHGDLLRDRTLKEKMLEICNNLDLHVVKTFKHTFNPQGTSLMLILEESHFAVHSWPEKGYCHIDVVTCTKKEHDLLKVASEVSRILSSQSIRIINLKY